jgi:tyrosyl-DNA phosphodiesterase-1
MFCQRKQWDVATFPKKHFYDSNSKRGKILMHSKVCKLLGGRDESNRMLSDDSGYPRRARR